MKRPASLSASLRQSDDSLKLMRDKRMKLSHQIHWEVMTLPKIPLFYIPNRTTSTIIHAMPIKEVASRIVDAVFSLSAVGDFDDSQVRASLKSSKNQLVVPLYNAFISLLLTIFCLSHPYIIGKSNYSHTRSFEV